MSNQQPLGSETMAYVGRKPCGCLVAATVDDGSHNVADDVRDFILRGYTIEHVPIEGMRLKRCTCPKPANRDYPA